MKRVHVAAATLNQTPLDWDANLANMRAAIATARERGVTVLCLPELCVTGYGCEDAFFSPAVRRMARRVLFELLPETHGLAVSVGLPILHSGALYNACALLVDGRLAGAVAKQHLAGDGLHYEPRWFKPWPEGTVVTARLDGQPVPLGDLVFEIDHDVRIGFEICEDAWVAHRPGADLARLGVDLLLNPSASHFALGKARTRRQLVAEGSRAFGVSYVYTNLLGNEAGRIVYDGHALIASQGEIVAEGPRLGCSPVHVTDAVIDVDVTRTRRVQSVSATPELDVDPRRVVSCSLGLRLDTGPRPQSDAPASGERSWELSTHLEEEEFSRAIALGLFDSLRKSRSSGFVVSLSGGADSAAVACLVALSVRFGVEELGLEDFLARSGLARPSEPAGAAATLERILTTVYQSTRNSSETTRSAARRLAQGLGANHLELDVDGIAAAYTEQVEKALGRQIDWSTDDIALQNIQARTRGPAVWMIANIRNALLLATSNRSEAAVGYTTMDGDTCGGLSPIAGIDKAFLRRWLRWLESTGPLGLGPIPELAGVNALTPTAELRPAQADQTDEDDLMPYPVLDAIEDEAIGKKRSPVEVLDVLSARFEAHGRAQLAVWVRRFFELFARNQWKRERYAPSYHVDDKNLDPKTWCRFPILSGAFRRELADLDRMEEQRQGEQLEEEK